MITPPFLQDLGPLNLWTSTAMQGQGWLPWDEKVTHVHCSANRQYTKILARQEGTLHKPRRTVI